MPPQLNPATVRAGGANSRSRTAATRAKSAGEFKIRRPEPLAPGRGQRAPIAKRTHRTALLPAERTNSPPERDAHLSELSCRTPLNRNGEKISRHFCQKQP